MPHQLMLRISALDLENLLGGLTVNSVQLRECVTGVGSELPFSAPDLSAIYYNITGTGQMIVGDYPPILLLPHTLIVVPRVRPAQIKCLSNPQVSTFKTEEAQFEQVEFVQRKVRVSDAKPHLTLICSYFGATFGSSVDLFAGLSSPVVEQFNAADQLESKLRSALIEFTSREVGSTAMTTALMKQVLVILLRRCLSSSDSWVEQFSLLRDPQIAHAFAEMVSRPSAPHSVDSLSRRVGLSRSVFMARFASGLGCPPIAVLRQLRMRQAATMLNAGRFTVDQVSYGVGYTSRSSFCRAFRRAYACDPSDYRATTQDKARVGDAAVPDEKDPTKNENRTRSLMSTPRASGPAR